MPSSQSPRSTPLRAISPRSSLSSSSPNVGVEPSTACEVARADFDDHETIALDMATSDSFAGPMTQGAAEIDFHALRLARARQEEEIAQRTARLQVVGREATSPNQTRPAAKSRSGVTRHSSRSARLSSPGTHPLPPRTGRGLGAARRFDRTGTRRGAAHAAPSATRETRETAPVLARFACHHGLLAATLLLVLISLPLIFSASAASARGASLPMMVGVAAVALFLMVRVSCLTAEKMRCLVWGLYGAALLGLVLTKWGPWGVSMGNTERWLDVGLFTIQVSEFMKIALVGVLADFWWRVSARQARTPWPWLVVAGLTLVPAALCLVQPHLSVAVLLCVVPFAVLIFAGAPGRVLAGILMPIAVLGGLMFVLCATHKAPLLQPYQQDRVAALFNGDDRGNSYQALQSQRAIERGGLLGAGLGASIYKQGHLPAPHTDFIFSVIVEELGLAGAGGLLALYLVVIFFCFQTANNTRDRFGSALCAGVGSLFAVQVLWNVAIVSGLLPVTGVPLPIITSGNSSLLSFLIGLGLVLGVSRAASAAAVQRASLELDRGEDADPFAAWPPETARAA